MKADIFSIKKFAVHDGDGIRTTVFFKGCPLRCRWCHNPEGIMSVRQIAFYPHKCTLCGACAEICDCHKIQAGIHTFARTDCNLCGRCVEKCLNGALEQYGMQLDTEQICELLLEDRAFYETTGGGITLSGGECLLQADACAEILRRMKQEGIDTAVDTCGMVSRAAIDKVIEDTDVFLYDLKAIDDDVHINATGLSNKQILSNFIYLTDMGKKVEVRYPYVPGYTDSQAEKIASFLYEHKSACAVRILSYHNFAGSKYDALQMENTLPAQLPSGTDIARAKHIFEAYNIKCV